MKRKTTTAICFKVKKFVEELSTKKKKLIHYTKQSMAPARSPQSLWASGGPNPTLLRQWSARGGGKNLQPGFVVSSSGSQM
ncbi:hypothetical protein DPMN_107578 [Dreissena polymorpha]|uniref:Uncharacterized protein n=1 Tax=Dreissena polymorpha TaxID=45954 RepID=A0A9D4K757_DREPO|nr:hypothetical protein DPMN_107578 [Dreissena polymorpha]